MDKGKLIALDTPKNIKASVDKTIVEIVCTPAREAYYLIKNSTDYEAQMFGDRMDIGLSNYEKDYPVVEKLLKENSINIVSHRTITPSLENVFMHLIKEAN